MGLMLSGTPREHSEHRDMRDTVTGSKDPCHACHTVTLVCWRDKKPKCNALSRSVTLVTPAQRYPA